MLMETSDGIPLGPTLKGKDDEHSSLSHVGPFMANSRIMRIHSVNCVSLIGSYLLLCDFLKFESLIAVLE